MFESIVHHLESEELFKDVENNIQKEALVKFMVSFLSCHNDPHIASPFIEVLNLL
jgi:hypothetical protein